MSKNENADERRVHVIAADTIQNHFFVQRLNEHVPAVLHPDLEEYLSLLCLCYDGQAALLIDITSFGMDRILGLLGQANLPPNVYPALLNVHHHDQRETECVAGGIRGMFFEDDPMELVIKGVCALLDGTVWISRETLFQAAVRPVRVRPVDSRPPVGDQLTRREREILGLICIGSTNQEIADKLFISTNTVKTHIYKIYKKINVPNRMQAALWGAKNL